MPALLHRIVKEALFNAPLRFRKFFFPKFMFNMQATHLVYLCQCLERTKEVPGAILEMGCATGETAIFLNKYMDGIGVEKTYFAVDTFCGFTSQDVEYEVTCRNKKKEYYAGGYVINSKRWFDGTMAMNDIHRVTSIQADANTYDFSQLGPLSFSLLDVDLYRPISRALPLIYDVLSPGGVLVVDDCKQSSNRFDGASQAYQEFCAQLSVPLKIVYTKLGVIEKPIG